MLAPVASEQGTQTAAFAEQAAAVREREGNWTRANFWKSFPILLEDVFARRLDAADEVIH